MQHAILDIFFLINGLLHVMKKGEIGQGGLGGVASGGRCFNVISRLLSHACSCFESLSIANDIQVNCHVISMRSIYFLLSLVVISLFFLHVTFVCIRKCSCNSEGRINHNLCKFINRTARNKHHIFSGVDTLH